jgi:hypothetical protein
MIGVDTLAILFILHITCIPYERKKKEHGRTNRDEQASLLQKKKSKSRHD